MQRECVRECVRDRTTGTCWYVYRYVYRFVNNDEVEVNYDFGLNKSTMRELRELIKQCNTPITAITTLPYVVLQHDTLVTVTMLARAIHKEMALRANQHKMMVLRANQHKTVAWQTNQHKTVARRTNAMTARNT